MGKIISNHIAGEVTQSQSSTLWIKNKTQPDASLCKIFGGISVLFQNWKSFFFNRLKYENSGQVYARRIQKWTNTVFPKSCIIFKRS